MKRVRWGMKTGLFLIGGMSMLYSLEKNEIIEKVILLMLFASMFLSVEDAIEGIKEKTGLASIAWNLSLAMMGFLLIIPIIIKN